MGLVALLVARTLTLVVPRRPAPGGQERTMTELPPTRWELWRDQHDGYQARFAELIAEGQDIDGEARLVDVLAPRRARVLDAGSGMGRVAAAVAARGHHVVGVEKDPVLVADSRARYPDIPVVEQDLLAVSPGTLEKAGLPASYDVVAAVGNVMIFLADGTQSEVLRALGDLLAPGGRILVGFHQQSGPSTGNVYPFAEFAKDVTGAGLVVQHRFGTYELGPADDSYVVAVLARA